MEVDGNSLKTIYMQFNLQAIQSVSSAILRLRVSNASNGAQSVKKVANNSWKEHTLTYNNRPLSSTTITSLNGGSVGNWVSIDITDYVRSMKGGKMSIAIESSHSNGLDFISKEAADSKPELIIKN